MIEGPVLLHQDHDMLGIQKCGVLVRRNGSSFGYVGQQRACDSTSGDSLRDFSEKFPARVHELSLSYRLRSICRLSASRRTSKVLIFEFENPVSVMQCRESGWSP